MLTKDFDVSTFLDHLIFHWLKDNYFPDLLFTTQDMASLRQATLHGMALPVTALVRIPRRLLMKTSTDDR